MRNKYSLGQYSHSGDLGGAPGRVPSVPDVSIFSINKNLIFIKKRFFYNFFVAPRKKILYFIVVLTAFLLNSF